MSAAFVEFAVKFDILQSAVMHVRAERGDCDVEKVSDDENRHARIYPIAITPEPCGKKPNTTWQIWLTTSATTLPESPRPNKRA